MFQDLIESIRFEAAERGSLRAAYQRSPGMSKLAKQGATRFRRHAEKRELAKVKKDPAHEPNIPRSGTRGYAD